MKLSTVLATLAAAVVPLASANVIDFPILSDMIVKRLSGDCAFGVVTPQGCG
jgi:hypothetical protein